MKFFRLVILVLVSSSVFAQDAATPTPYPLLSHWSMEKVPWDLWFKKNNSVTDKTDYVHILWDAQDFKSNFEVKDRKLRLAEAALQLVKRLYPADAKADLVKVDIVYVLTREYGEPKWDDLQQVAHLEFSRTKALKNLKRKTRLSDGTLNTLFTKFEVYE